MKLNDAESQSRRLERAALANHRYGVRCGRTVISTGQHVAGEVKT